MRVLISSFLLLFLTFTHSVSAEGRPVVVELFTSQGCSSCPPADEILTRLSKQKNVIALSLHVDYWDYLGWKDDFASKAHSDRQRAYARVASKRTIYTPQMVIQGTSHAVGNRASDVASLVAHHSNKLNVVDLSLKRNGNKLAITARAKSGSVGRTSIQLVRFMPRKSVKIRAGELAGRQLHYTNIVTEWHALSQWNGHGEKTLKVDITGDDAIVVLIQSVGLGPIIAAEVLH